LEDLVLVEAMAALAAAGGTALVEAATTDAWQKAKVGFMQIFGRGDDSQAAATEGRLENTRNQLVHLTGTELERVRGARAAEWTTRLQDALEDNPDSAKTLQRILAELAATGVPGSVEAKGRSVIVAGDMANVANLGGISAGAIHGDVSTSVNPPQPKVDLS
jgi:hypothetical protein